MKFVLDEYGLSLPDVQIAGYIDDCISNEKDIHVGSSLSLDVFRARMCRIEPEDRPKYEVFVYGVKLELTECMTVVDYGPLNSDPRFRIFEDSLVEILGYVAKRRKATNHKHT